MTEPRPQPFELLFGEFRAERFPAIRAALGEETDVNAFVLAAPALELLRDLRPDEGLGDGIDDFVALVHAAYLFWRDGERATLLDEKTTRDLTHANGSLAVLGMREAQYVQFAPRIIWAQLDPEAAFEPLDGFFAIPSESTTLRLVACFGVHAQRPGVSVVAVQGSLPMIDRRDDGTQLFAPTMPGGDAAHLFAVNTPEELLLLGWRATRDGRV
jgi:hypothetical protein